MLSESLASKQAREFGRPLQKGETWAVALPGSERPGRSAVYRNRLFLNELLLTLDPEIRTAYDFFEKSARINARRKCLGHRPWNAEERSFDPYVWQDYQTIAQRRSDVGAGLVHIHRQAGVSEDVYGVGLWCQNRPEWQLVDLGCMSQSLYIVSIYDTLGPTTTEYIIRHSELRCVATSVSHIPTLISLKAEGTLPDFKIIISLDPLDSGDQPGTSKLSILRSFADKVGLTVYTLDQVERLGREQPLAHRPPSPEDLITINYTSGTTGDPKGVVLTHKAAVAATSASLVSLPQGGSDMFLSFLPLAHIFGRICEHAALWAGAAIGYFHGDVTELVDDLKLIRPTIFAGVPRLYNRFGSAIRANTVEAPGFRGQLSKYVTTTKLNALVKPPPGTEPTNKHFLWDRVWGSKVSSAIGLDRCRQMITGSAPIDVQLHQFLRVVFANSIVQGYGLTETYACSVVQMPDDLSAGNCGALAATTEAILVDMPDMGYTSKDKPNPRGELCLRGNSLMNGYYKNEAETAKAIDADGWFHTGDIAEVDQMGRFKIVDRVKNVLKLSQGEYVSPEKIENQFLANVSWAMSLYVHGDSTQSSLVAVVGVDPAPFAAWWSGKSGEKVTGAKGDVPVDRAEIERLLARPDVRERVLAEFERVSKKTKMNKFEYAQAVRLFLEPFTIDNGLLTPTLKLKRPQTAKQFRSAIDDMYAEIESRPAKAKAML